MTFDTKHLHVESEPGKKVHVVIRNGKRKLDLYFVSPLKIQCAIEVEEEKSTKQTTK